jgi:hypothetical protein
MHALFGIQPLNLHKSCAFNPGGLSAAKRIISSAKKLLERRCMEMNQKIKELNPDFLEDDGDEQE